MTAAPLPTLDPAFFDAAQTAKAWPFEEARKIVRRLERTGKQEALFETGYGPSGLPHIGTFGEVARTTMVRTAFRLLTRDEVPTRLLCFSDDMDGMRKIPENVPDRSFLEPHLHKPLTSVPNPFEGEHYESFGHHNNAMLRRFLDTFGFNYEFASATDYYKSGKFDAALIRAAEKYDEIMGVMLPTLGAERQATYSPFLPISPTTGRVLYVPMKNVDPKAGTVTFDDEDGTETMLPVTGGHCKLQWKPDFGMRWYALGVDFEMFGKDHQTNQHVYDSICEILGGHAPEHYVFELFLDEIGQKISKSKGNGLTIDEWLTYASPESLALYMFQKPRVAKRLFFDVIPRAVDDYYTHVQSYSGQDAPAALENPAFHIHSGKVPVLEMPVTFGLLLNLASASNAHDKSILWNYITRRLPGTTAATNPELDRLAEYAVAYFKDEVEPTKVFRAPTDKERVALQDLYDQLEGKDGLDAKELQDIVYAVGNGHQFVPLRDWFGAIYGVLLGAEQGPRFGSFIALYGVNETRKLIADALAGKLVKAA